MKTLIVDDEFISRIQLQGMLNPYGECHVVVNGREAIEAFMLAGFEGRPYDLICMEYMIPEVDGQEVLKRIRASELSEGILPGTGVKVIMMTFPKNKHAASPALEQCDAYLVKPVVRVEMLDLMRKFGLMRREGNDPQPEALRKIITICSYCKSIRNHDGSWDRIEKYLSDISDILLSHGICPGCVERESCCDDLR